MSGTCVADVFTGIATRCWFTGGRALEMHLGRSWRAHVDIDVGICRDDVGSLAPLLDEWKTMLQRSTG